MSIVVPPVGCSTWKGGKSKVDDGMLRASGCDDEYSVRSERRVIYLIGQVIARRIKQVCQRTMFPFLYARQRRLSDVRGQS